MLFGLAREEFLGPTKLSGAVRAKETLIVAGREPRASLRELAEIVGIDNSTVSPRHDRSRARLKGDEQAAALDKVLKQYGDAA